MRFEIERAVELLSATPATLRSLLGNLSDEWTSVQDPRSDGWVAFDVIGHLIHGEETDWIPRARLILAQAENRTFVPFDRFAQFEVSKGKSLADLLDEFERRRWGNIDELHSWELTDEQLDLEGMHPELGPVSLRQLLATWVVHDLNHVRQIATAMAKKYESEVGPWKEYLSILH
ncbi:MAG TPA: DinB family protein [Pyrinomonadaceae bacterium]|nr:DinB family protein [Pyrinomonadaceae bacterium]